MGRLLNFSDASNFAIHALILLARAPRGTRLSSAELAATLEVSEAHLGKVLQRLAHLGFVDSRRGPHGGFVLKRDPATVTLYDILTAIDGPLDAGVCALGRPLCIGRTCALGCVLQKVHAIVHEHFAGTRLSDLVDRDLHERAPDG